jgi:hypothetical protein
VSRNKPTPELPEQVVSAAQLIPWSRLRKGPVELPSTVGARVPFKTKVTACSLMKRRDGVKQVDGAMLTLLEKKPGQGQRRRRSPSIICWW